MDVNEHIKEVGKTLAGGVGVAGTTHAAFDIAAATQYASFAAAVATTIYFVVTTYLAIKNHNKNGTP